MSSLSPTIAPSLSPPSTPFEVIIGHEFLLAEKIGLAGPVGDVGQLDQAAAIAHAGGRLGDLAKVSLAR